MSVVNLDAIAPRPIEIQKGEQTWKLRNDVPSGRLARVFEVIELERALPKLDMDSDDFTALRAQAEALRAAEAEVERVTLEVLGDIWRWTDASVTDEWIAEMLAPSERRDMLQVFFLGLLARSGKLPSAPTDASSSTDSPSPSAQAETMSAPATANSPTSTARGSTRSATRSQPGSSDQKVRPIQTRTASGKAASIY